MKRRTPNPNYESEDNNCSASDDNNNRLQRRRRRQQQTPPATTGNDDAVYNNVPGRDGSEQDVTAAVNGPGPTITVHVLENIGENIYLPDYVRQHNSTLTFPEKVCLMLLLSS
jgi:hypothetical protein